MILLIKFKIILSKLHSTSLRDVSIILSFSRVEICTSLRQIRVYNTSLYFNFSVKVVFILVKKIIAKTSFTLYSLRKKNIISSSPIMK